MVQSDKTWRMECRQRSGGCGYLSIGSDRTSTWTVALPPGLPDAPLDLEDALRRELGAATPVTDWECPCCGGGASDRTLIRRTAPQCLIIQLLRFSMEGGALRKVPYPVRIPVEGLRVELAAGGAAEDSALFSLKAYATHTRGMLGGHYGAVIQRAGRWWLANDSKVTAPGALPSREADDTVYALFLQREMANPCPRRRASRCRATCGRLLEDEPLPMLPPRGSR